MYILQIQNEISTFTQAHKQNSLKSILKKYILKDKNIIYNQLIRINTSNIIPLLK